jgi:hypothetical protein
MNEEKTYCIKCGNEFVSDNVLETKCDKCNLIIKRQRRINEANKRKGKKE